MTTLVLLDGDRDGDGDDDDDDDDDIAGELAQRSDEPPAARWWIMGSRLRRGHRPPQDHVH